MTTYVLANGQSDDRAIYYTGKEDFHGGELWGNINDAKQFKDIQEIFDYIKKDGCTASPIIVEISDRTWKVIEQGYKDLWSGKQSVDRDVYHKYNTVSYITNSQKE